MLIMFEGIEVDSDVEISPSNMHEFTPHLMKAISGCMELTGDRPTKIRIRHGLFVLESPKLARATVILRGGQ